MQVRTIQMRDHSERPELCGHALPATAAIFERSELES
jgi:hypothetical protein